MIGKIKSENYKPTFLDVPKVNINPYSFNKKDKSVQW